MISDLSSMRILNGKPLFAKRNLLAAFLKAANLFFITDSNSLEDKMNHHTNHDISVNLFGFSIKCQLF